MQLIGIAFNFVILLRCRNRKAVVYMPRVCLNRIQNKPKDFCRWLAGEMQVKQIRQQDIAEWLGVSQMAISKKLKNYSFTYIDMLTIFDELKTEQEERIKVML